MKRAHTQRSRLTRTWSLTLCVGLCLLQIIWGTRDASYAGEKEDTVKKSVSKNGPVIIGLPAEQAEGFSQTSRDIELKTAEWTKHYQLAKSLVSQGKYEEAISEYEKATASSGGGWREFSARRGLADSYQTTERYLAAADEIQWMLNNSAEWVKPYLSERLASVQLAARGDFRGAIGHAQRVLDLYAESPPPHDHEETYKQHLHLLEEKARAQPPDSRRQ
jgi:tetratricopeptide (TPR) repeat protein